MKQKIIMTHNDAVIFKGNPINLPFKEKAVKEKSLELFDDEDPCIIHQSHIAREFTQMLLSVFKQENASQIQLSSHKDALYFIDAPEDTTIELKG